MFGRRPDRTVFDSRSTGKAARTVGFGRVLEQCRNQVCVP